MRWVAVRHSCATGAVVLAVAACSNGFGPDDLRGVWGSEAVGAQLTVTGTEATFETPCFTGTFTLPSARFEDGGTFEATGLVSGHGGAPPQGPPPAPSPATFAGLVSGRQLALWVNKESSNAEPWTLRRGVRVEVFGCP